MFVLHSTTFNIKACKPLAISARCFLIATLHRILFAQWLFGLVAALILMCIAQTAAPSTGSPEFNTPTEATQNSQESAEDAATLESSYRRAWQLVKDNTMYPERLKNWSDWEHKFDGKISTSRQLEDAITLMLSALGDQYTYFRNSSDTRCWHTHDDENCVVSAYKLPSNIAYIAIHSFSSLHTAAELESALQEVQNASAYIVDLRGNRGGYVEQALASFELMIDEGIFVTMSGREDGKPYSEILKVQTFCVKRTVNGAIFMEARKSNLCGTKPITVLIDRDTRSAAEMFAGALRDNQRAKLVGCRSFGKGVVQSSWLIDPGCSIKIAMAHYYLPSGKDINGIGINPDLAIDFNSSNRSPVAESSRSAPLTKAQLKSLMPELSSTRHMDKQQIAKTD